MQAFTIRDIENLTGIKAHTIRIWEQRYRLMANQRATGMHRTYSNEDLKHLLKISTLYHHGYKISKIAGLNRDEIDRITLNTMMIGEPFLIYVNQMVEAAIDFDEPRFENILSTCILHYSFEKTIFRIIYPFLNKIGLLWSTSHIVPAMEHFASALIMKKLLVAINGVERPAANEAAPVVLLFTPEAERHEIPVLMMQYLLKKQGISTVMMGQHASPEALSIYCSSRPVTHLYTHIITYLQTTDIDEYVAELSRRFAARQIVLSGNIVQSMQRSFVNVRILKNEDEMLSFVRQL
ncbi:MAG TPA: MerR family transcriptional regulator [Chitinophagaceae bacterium]|nr:MerR family transcriptional regulator [Chitinophagaceae bacterium]